MHTNVKYFSNKLSPVSHVLVGVLVSDTGAGVQFGAQQIQLGIQQGLWLSGEKKVHRSLVGTHLGQAAGDWDDTVSSLLE